MSSSGYLYPVAISRLSEGEISPEPQNWRAIKWLLEQPGGSVVVVTPQKQFSGGRLRCTSRASKARSAQQLPRTSTTSSNLTETSRTTNTTTSARQSQPPPSWRPSQFTSRLVGRLLRGLNVDDRCVRWIEDWPGGDAV